MKSAEAVTLRSNARAEVATPLTISLAVMPIALFTGVTEIETDCAHSSALQASKPAVPSHSARVRTRFMGSM